VTRKTAKQRLRSSIYSTQTLPAGVLSVFLGSGFSGSSLLSRTKPTKHRCSVWARSRRDTRARVPATRAGTADATLRGLGQLSEPRICENEGALQARTQSVAERTVSVPLNIVAMRGWRGGGDEAALRQCARRAVVSFHVPAGASRSWRELSVTEGIVTRSRRPRSTRES